MYTKSWPPPSLWCAFNSVLLQLLPLRVIIYQFQEHGVTICTKYPASQCLSLKLMRRTMHKVHRSTMKRIQDVERLTHHDFHGDITAFFRLHETEVSVVPAIIIDGVHKHNVILYFEMPSCLTTKFIKEILKHEIHSEIYHCLLNFLPFRYS